MANITYSSGAPDVGGGLRTALQRGLRAIGQQVSDLRWEIAEQRRLYQVETAFRRHQMNLLRDIGLDRSAC